MSGAVREGKNKKKAKLEPNIVSWQDKKSLADKEEDGLIKEIDDLRTWTNMIDSMNDQQLKKYLDDRPEGLKTVKIQKRNSNQKMAGKPKFSTCNGIMASVWKFHREEDDHELNI